MSQRPKIDLVDYERQCRDSQEEAFTLAALAVETGDADPIFIAAQREFIETRVQFALACARADNAGHPHEAIIAAAADNIGQMLGLLMLSQEGDQARAQVLLWTTNAMNAALEQRFDGRVPTPPVRARREPNVP